jgi:hypothetical protein
MSDRLTPKQEQFCLKYQELGNASEAYRQSYDASRMKPETVNRRAFDLLQNGNIAARIDGLRAAAAKIVVLDKAMVLNDLLRVKDEAMAPNIRGEMTNPLVATKTLELLGKHLALWTPDVQIGIQINNNARESFESILKRAIVIDGGLPDFEARKQRDIGALYQRWSNGEAIEESPIIGGLPSPFE